MTPFSSAIFCDDIREERSGKLLIIGMYTGQLVATVPAGQAAQPVLLPTFAAVVTYNTPLSAPIPTSVIFKLYNTDDSVIAESGGIVAPEAIARVRNTDPEAIYLTIGARFQFSPVLIPRPGLIKLRVVVDGDERWAPSLGVIFNAVGAVPPSA
jgi:hypothetical protein